MIQMSWTMFGLFAGITVFLFLICLGLGGYLVYKMIMKKKKLNELSEKLEELIASRERLFTEPLNGVFNEEAQVKKYLNMMVGAEKTYASLLIEAFFSEDFSQFFEGRETFIQSIINPVITQAAEQKKEHLELIHGAEEKIEDVSELLKSLFYHVYENQFSDVGTPPFTLKVISEQITEHCLPSEAVLSAKKESDTKGADEDPKKPEEEVVQLKAPPKPQKEEVTEVVIEEPPRNDQEVVKEVHIEPDLQAEQEFTEEAVREPSATDAAMADAFMDEINQLDSASAIAKLKGMNLNLNQQLETLRAQHEETVAENESLKAQLAKAEQEKALALKNLDSMYQEYMAMFAAEKSKEILDEEQGARVSSIQQFLEQKNIQKTKSRADTTAEDVGK